MLGHTPFISFDFDDDETIRQKAENNVITGGPNSGFEIEDERFFTDPELANTFPELKEDIDLIVSTESYIDRLVDFDRRLKATGGISRSMSHELFELVPDLQSYSSPSHFTEDVSGVRWVASCEQLSVQIWVIIAAAAAFVIALIYKFLRWIFGGSSNNSTSGSNDIKTAQEGIREAGKKVRKQEEIMEHVSEIVSKTNSQTVELDIPSIVNKDEIERSHIPEEIKERILSQHQDIGTSTSAIVPEPKRQTFRLKELLISLEGGKQAYDYLVNPNRYARVVYDLRTSALDLIMDSISGFRLYAGLVSKQADLLKEMLDELDGELDPKSENDMRRFDSALRTLEVTDQQFATIRVGRSTFDNMGGWATTLTTSIVETAHQSEKFSDIDMLIARHAKASKLLAKADFSSLVLFFDTLKDALPVLDRVKQMGEYQEGKSRVMEVSRSGQERAAAVMRVQRSIAANISALMRVYSEVSRVIVEVNLHGFKVVDTLRKHSAEIIAAYRRFGSIPPPSLVELNRELEGSTESYRENIIGRNMVPVFSSKPVMRIWSGDKGDDDDPDAEFSDPEDIRKMMEAINRSAGKKD